VANTNPAIQSLEGKENDEIKRVGGGAGVSRRTVAQPRRTWKVFGP
jgi:hypothetical protein